MAKHPKPVAPVIDKLQLAAILGVTPTSIARYEKHKLDPLKVNKQGKVGGTSEPTNYLASDVIDWLLRRQRREFVSSGEDGEQIDVQAERAKEMRLKNIGQELSNEEREIKNKLLRGENAPVAIIAEVLSDICSSVASRLDSIKVQVKRRQPELSEASLNAIDEELTKARNELENYEPRLSRVLGKPDGSSPKRSPATRKTKPAKSKPVG